MLTQVGSKSLRFGKAYFCRANIFLSRSFVTTSSTFQMSETNKGTGFDTLCLHAGYDPDPSVQYGLGQGAPRGIPVYRTTPFIFKDTEHAANLIALTELGNIYSRIINPTTHILESRYAQVEGGHPLAGVATSRGTTAIFYSIINLA